MLTYPNINPVAVQIGPVAIYWYGIMYSLGFAGAFWLCYSRRLRETPPWTSDELIDLFFYGALGVIFGGTFGHLLFYTPHDWLADPLKVLRFWEPGRSFHGGLIGVGVALYVFCVRHKRRFWEVVDFVTPTGPIGFATGRLGNFINGELWGRVTDVSWGMVFPHVGSEPRHPSQLYEFGLEGVLLFIILFWYSQKRRPSGAVFGLFLILYGLFRFIVEFYREPEMKQGFIAFDWLTMGQALSLPMILIGIILFVYAYAKSNRIEIQG